MTGINDSSHFILVTNSSTASMLTASSTWSKCIIALACSAHSCTHVCAFAMLTNAECGVQIHWSYIGQVLCHLSNRPCHWTHCCSSCSHTGVCVCSQTASSAVYDRCCTPQCLVGRLWPASPDHNRSADVCSLLGKTLHTLCLSILPAYVTS